MLRAPSLAAKCALSAVGANSLRKAGGRAAGLRTLADTPAAVGSTAIAHHVLDGRKQHQQQQRRSVSYSSRRCGWTTAIGIPGPGGGVRECDAEVLATRQALERNGTPAAMLTTRLKAMFSSKGNGPWWMAVHLLEKGRQEGIKDVKVYNVVLKMIATCERMSGDKLNEMDRLFEQMTNEDGLLPEALTYSHLIYGYSQAKNEQKAVQLLHEMVARGLEPERRTMSSMIFAHSWGSVEDMRRVAAEMRAKGWEPTRRANSAMIGALRRVDDWKGILDVTEAMLESKQKPTEAALVLAIKAAANAGRVALARKLLVMHGKNKHRPQESLYVCVMVTLRNASQHEECLACWRELVLLDGFEDVKLDDRTYNLALSAAVGAERWEEMEAIFDMMQAKNVEPSLPTWRSMVDVWSLEETGNEARLDRIFGSIERRGWQPDRAVRLHVGMAYARSKAWPKAMAWFEPALAEDNKVGPHVTEQLLASLGGMGRYGEMRQVWARSAGSKDTGLFRANAMLRMAEAALELEDPDWALELHHAASKGADATSHMWQVVVKVLLKAGRLEGAAHVMEQSMPGEGTKVKSPVTLDGIVSAFSDLAPPEEVSAFVHELRTAESEPDASRVERTSAQEDAAALAVEHRKPPNSLGEHDSNRQAVSSGLTAR